MKTFILALFIIASCSTTNKGLNSSNMNDNNENNTIAQNTTNYEIISEGPISGVNDAQIRVVKEKEGLKEIYEYLNENRSPSLLMPNIDFDEDIIVALFMGEKNYGGFKISVDHIEENAKEIIIHVKETAPSGKFATMVITQPYCIFKIKQTAKEIVFKKVN